MKINFFILAFFLASFGAFSQKKKSTLVVPKSDSSIPTAYFDLLLNMTEATTGFTPTVASRAFGYVGLALYESVVPFSTEYRSLSGQLNGFVMPKDLLKKVKKTDFYAPAAANMALWYMSERMYEGAPYLHMVQIYALRDTLQANFKRHIDPVVLQKSNEIGLSIAKSVYEYSKIDGGDKAFVRPYDLNYKLPICDSCFIVNTVVDLENTGPIHPYWGKNRPFLTDNASDFGIAPKVSFSTDKNSDFYKQALEVYEATKNVKPKDDKFNIAYYWDDATFMSFTAAGHSISMLTQILKKEPKMLERAAEAYAKLGLATSDAFICCWKAKYKYNLLRPYTYIKRHIDPMWEPLLITPPFPEFPSGHSVQSGAMEAVMVNLFGENFAFEDYSKYGYTNRPRQYKSFREAANEAAISRLYGGIHYRDAIAQGLEMGRKVGANVLKLKFYK